MTYFPNPTDGIVRLSSIENMDIIEVHNLLGQQVLKVMPNDQNYSLNLTELNSGIYLVNVMTQGGNKVIRIIKE